MDQGRSRTENVARNIVWGYIANFATMILKFISRTVFVYTLGSDYLGLNGLFTNVLGLLSFTELGIGGVLNYSLYRPLAVNDTEKIKSLMALYKKAYRVIMLVVLAIGLIIVPLLPYIINDAGEIEHVYLYYGFFLFNTVTSYMVSYKNGLMNAAQKEYVVTNITAAVNAVTVVVQCVALLVFRNYFVYLFVQAAFQLLQKIITSVYVDREFPLLKDKNVRKLPKEDTEILKNNVEAMVYHKIGDVCVHQTDNIIVSAFISLSVVGKISNYTLVTTSLSTIIAIIINNCVSSIGNFISVEAPERKKEIFRVYNFLAFWIYGFVAIELFALFQPFIQVWVGEENLIGSLTIGIIIIEYYFSGLRVAVANFKSACGIFQADKYIGIVQAVVNLVFSIALAKMIGLPGVYIGTVAQGVVDFVWRPRLVYKLVFKESSKEYYLTWFKQFAVFLMLAAASCFIASRILTQISLGRIIIAGFVILAFVNLILFAIYRKTTEFKFLQEKAAALIDKYNILRK